MTLDQMIRTAAEMPKDHPDRRGLLAAIKVAVSPDTEDFVEWVLATQDPIPESAMVKFLEAKLGQSPEPAPAKGAAPRRTGDLEVGEKVLVDKTKNTNTLNTDACAMYHNRVGQISDVSPAGLVVQFYEGDNNNPSIKLTSEKQLFNGVASGKKTGLYRWTPRPDYQQSSPYKKVLFEVVYLRGGTNIDRRRMDVNEDYVNKGTLQGENRSVVYYTGNVGRFAFNQEGEAYFTLSIAQRDTPTTFNPVKGKLLYIGVAGHRPGGWEDEAVKMGLRTV